MGGERSRGRNGASRDARRHGLDPGDGQSGPPGTELPEPLVVRLLTGAGRPVPGQIVNFVVTRGGGSVFAGRAITDADGIAKERWTLGAAPGENEVQARAVDATTGERLVFGTFRASAGEAPPPAAAGPVSLKATLHWIREEPRTSLAWSGPEPDAPMDVYRDGALRANVSGRRRFQDRLHGPGRYVYRVCRAGTDVCSQDAEIAF
jgi:hypothetical protein